MARSIRISAAAAVTAGALGLGLLVSAPAQAATERADTLAQARNDTAIAAKQVVRERLHSAADQDWFRYVFTKKVRAVVTLGSLPANYNLAVYKADGTRVAASNHAGKGFERVYFTAAKGTYFVRVASTQGSSSAKYALWFRHLTEDLSLQSFTVPAVNSGYPFIVAEFVNTTPRWLSASNATIYSVAADGRVLQQDAASPMQQNVPPHGMVHVSSSSVLPLPVGHHHFRLTMNAGFGSVPSIGELRLSTGKTLTENGIRVHAGTVRNTGTVARGGDDDQDGPSVEVAYYNRNGTIVGVGKTSIGPVAPGGSVGYRLLARHSYYWHSPFSTPNRYTTRLISSW